MRHFQRIKTLPVRGGVTIIYPHGFPLPFLIMFHRTLSHGAFLSNVHIIAEKHYNDYTSVFSFTIG